jgi:thiol:disulfide interchange protein DsbC
MLKKTLYCLLSAMLFNVTLAHADEADVRKAATSLFRPGTKIDEIRKAEVAGIYEVRVGSNLFYFDEKGKYAIMGDIIDTQSKRNLTEEKRDKLSAITFADLPLNQAIKTVRGNGKRVFATFEDPNCGYCKKLARDIATMTDFTMYTFLLPILSPDSTEKARNIWCAPDRSKAWIDHMTKGTNLPQAPSSCDTPIDKNLELGQRYNVQGTPNIVLTDGTRLPGYVPAAQLSKMLDQQAKAK